MVSSGVRGSKEACCIRFPVQYLVEKKEAVPEPKLGSVFGMGRGAEWG